MECCFQMYYDTYDKYTTYLIELFFIVKFQKFKI